MLSNLALLRKKHKLSQKELAQKFNVNQNTISRWENGDRQIDLDTLKELANFFNVSVDFLLGVGAAEQANATIKHIVEQDPNLNELLNLYNKLDVKFKNRLLGAGYVMLAEQNDKDGLTLGSLSKTK